MSESFEPETGEMIVKRVSVPIGLEELMEGLTKEVLLKKPDDIYLFAAEYFSRLLLLRDKGSYRAKPLKNAQSVAKQTPKQPIEKLLVRGASKQLSRQISIRSESPIKKVAPVKRPPARMGKENAERNKFIDRRKMKRSEGVETKATESKSKQVLTTPRHTQEVNEDKGRTINKRDRSLSTARRGRSSSRNAQVTPRQKDISGKAEMLSENEKYGKVGARSGDKHKSEKEKPVISQISSIEETEEYVKDGKLTVTPPKIIKRPQAVDSQEVISSLIVPQVVSHIASFTDNNDPHINHETAKIKSIEDTNEVGNNKITNEQQKINDNEINKLLVRKDTAGDTITEDHNLINNEEKSNNQTKDDKDIKEEQDIDEGSADSKSKMLIINVEEAEKNLKSSTYDDKNKDKHSDTDEMKTSIVTDTQESVKEESKSDENCEKTYLEDLKHEVEKPEISKKEAKEKIENLAEDRKETSSKLKSEIQDEIEILEKQQNEKMKSKISDNLEDTNLKSKNNELEASAEADKNLIPTFQNDVASEAKKQKDTNFLETDYVSSYKFQLEEGNSNQQNESRVEKEKENSNITSNSEKQADTSDKGKEFEEGKTDEIINDTKIEKTEQVSKASLGKTKSFEEVTIDETLNDTSSKEESDILLNKEPKNMNKRDITKPSKTYNEFKIENKQTSKAEEKLGEFNRDSDDKNEIKDEKLYSEKPVVEDEDNVLERDEKTHAEKPPEERKNVFKSDSVLKKDDALSSEEKSNNEKSIKEEIKNELKKDGILCSEEKTDTKESVGKEINDILKKDEKADPEKPPEERKNIFENDVLKKDDVLSSEEKKENEKSIKEEIKSVFKKDDPLSGVEKTNTEESLGEVGKRILNQDDTESIEEKTDSKKSGGDESDDKLIEKSNIISNKDDEVLRSEEKSLTEKLIEEKRKNILKIDDAKSSEEKTDSKESIGDKIDDKLMEEKSDSVLNKEEKANTEKSTAGDDKNMLKRSNALSIEENIDTEMPTGETETVLKKEHVLSSEEKTDTKGLIREESKDIIKSEEKVNIEKSVAEDSNRVFKKNKDISSGEETNIKESIGDENKNHDKVLSNEEQIGIEKPTAKENRNVLKSDPLGTEEKTDMFTDESKNVLKDDALIIEEGTDTKKIIAENSESVSTKDYDSIRNEEVYIKKPTEEQSKNVLKKDDGLTEEVINIEKSLNEENKEVLNKNISSNKEKMDIKKPTQESSNVYDTLTIEDNKKTDTECTSEPQISDHVQKILIAENIAKQGSDNTVSMPEVHSPLKANSTGESDKEKGISGDLTENAYLREQTKPDASDSDRSDRSNISPLVKSESQQSEESQDHKAKGSIKNNEIKSSIASESKDEVSTDICSSSTAESIINSNNKETPTSSTNTTNKESDDTLDSETEESTQKKHIDSLIDQEKEFQTTKANDSNLEDKDQHVTHELKNTSQSSKDYFLDNGKNDMYNVIKSVLNISEGGLMDHGVKTHIGDFIQSEKYNVFDGTSNITSDPNLDEKNAEKLKKDQLEKFSTNENLNKQKEKIDDSLIRKEKVTESELQSQDNESNNKEIINSVINIVNDGSVDHKVKTYINNFIQKETQHVFVEKPGRISGTNADMSKEIDQVPLKKQLLKKLSVAESNGDAMSDSIVSETQTGQVDDMDKTYIYDFLREEKQNIFKHAINANEDFKRILEKDNKTKSSVLTTEIKLKGKEESPEQKKKSNEERKIKRVKSVDVIRDESKNMIQVKSRIPTADYRTRVKRDESGKHSIRIKRSGSHLDNVKVPDTDDTVTAVEKYVSSVHKKKEIPDDINSSNVIEDNMRNDKKITEPIKKKSEVALKSTSDVGTKQICEVSSQQKNKVKSDNEVNIKTNLDTPTLHQELKDAKDEADALQKAVKSDIALKEIVAVIKIQAWWRGYRVRKNKTNVLDKQSTKKHIENIEFSASDSNTDIKQMVEGSNRQNENRLEKAAVVIQKNWRDFMVRKRPLSGNPKKVENEDIKVEKEVKNMMEEGAKDIECTKPLDDSNETFVKAAVTIQKIWRGFRVRQLVVHKSKEKTDLSVLREKDLTREVLKENTQNSVEKLTEQKLMSPLKSEEEFTKAAIVIQKNWREFKTNPKSKNTKNISVPKIESTKQTITNNKIAHSQSMIQNEDEFIKAATLIQKIWRGFNARKLYKDHSKQNTNNKQKTESPDDDIINPKINELEEEKHNKIITESITKNKSEMLQLPSKSEDEFTKAAILIQKNWRGSNVRNLSKEGFKLKSSEEPKKIDPKEQTTSSQVLTKASQEVTQQSDEEFFKAATIIQKNWRGFNVRKLYKDKFKQQADSKKLAESSTPVHRKDSKSDSLKEEVTVVESTSPQKSTKLNISAESEDDLTKAAVLIQKNWKGFKVRNAQKDNFNPRRDTEFARAEQLKNIVTEEPTAIKQVKTQTFQEPSLLNQKMEDDFVKAAVMVQKIWRGFKVRKSLSKNQEQKKGNSDKSDPVLETPVETKLLGKPVETEKSEIETIKQADSKDRKSALKIQSLWRGYQVRKNINVIKNKLEDTFTTNDTGKGKELTDGDILNAATKIQAGVRGYLQRKKYKTDISKLNSISEEDCDEKHIKSIPDHKKEHESNVIVDEGKLSEEEILKALEDLNKLEVPNDIPVLHETDKPKFYRSNTVQEPEIVKKQNPQLFKYISVDAPNLLKIDNNNNPDKVNELSPPEIKVKTTTHDVEGCDQYKLTSDENLRGEMTENNLFFENLTTNISNVQQILSNDSKREDSSCQSRFGSISENSQLRDCKSTDTRLLISDENLVDISTNEKNKITQLHPSVAERSTDEVKTAVDQNFPHNKEVDNITSYNDNNEDKEEKNTYERPLSMDSNDSAVTVIYNEIPDTNKNSLENSSISDKVFETEGKPIEALSEHENLINDFQNKLLDQISGKNGSVEETVNKFDIEQLRKEFEEAGLIYNADDNNIRHENSREIIDDHDQLFDYLEGFELSTEKGQDNTHLKDPSPNLLSRDLPDIKEEDLENKSMTDNLQQINRKLSPQEVQDIKGKEQQSFVPNGVRINETMQDNDLNIEKIKSTLKECEDIAREINMGFETIKDDEIMKPESDCKLTDNIPEKKVTASNEPEQLFCGTGEQREQQMIPKDVEILTPVNSIEGNTFKITFNDDQNKSIEGSSNQSIDEASKSTPLNRLLHTGELHDSVIVPFPKESDSKSENKGGQRLSKDISETQNSKLLHTGELHDTIVIPLPIRVQNNLETDAEKQPNSVRLEVAEEVPLSSSTPDTNMKVQNIKDNNSNVGIQGLLHTGELHDILLTPLLIEAQNSLGENHDKLTKSLESDLGESAQKPISEVPINDQPTELLHTGELHDPVVLPLPKNNPDASNEDKGAANAEDNKEHTGDSENTPRQVDSESQTTGDPSIAVQLSDVPAGVEALTSPRPVLVVADVNGVAVRPAQTPDKGALPNASSSDLSSPSDLQGMESEKRTNATINNKSMEVEAATKIQAGFRGYQVRKQLKLKNGSSDINNQRRQLRRKSSGRLAEANRIAQNKPSEIEEKSAVKIQAGVRGFLVRRRQKKLKNQES